MEIAMVPHVTLEAASNHERKLYREDRENGLKIFLEAHLLDDRFMDNHTLGDVKALARRFDKKKGADFEQIWNETMKLTTKVKSASMVRYGEEWDKLKTVHFENRHEALRLYIEVLSLNRIITTEYKDDIHQFRIPGATIRY